MKHLEIGSKVMVILSATVVKTVNREVLIQSDSPLHSLRSGHVGPILRVKQSQIVPIRSEKKR